MRSSPTITRELGDGRRESRRVFYMPKGNTRQRRSRKWRRFRRAYTGRIVCYAWFYDGAKGIEP
jgi:hypothetical protein